MKKSLLFAAIMLSLPLGPAHASGGVIVETIKAHIEQHQTPAHREQPRQQRAMSRSVLDQWVRVLTDSATGSR